MCSVRSSGSIKGTRRVLLFAQVSVSKNMRKHTTPGVMVKGLLSSGCNASSLKVTEKVARTSCVGSCENDEEPDEPVHDQHSAGEQRSVRKL
jgi:hypothetical protein